MRDGFLLKSPQICHEGWFDCGGPVTHNYDHIFSFADQDVIDAFLNDNLLQKIDNTFIKGLLRHKEKNYVSLGEFWSEQPKDLDYAIVAFKKIRTTLVPFKKKKPPEFIYSFRGTGGDIYKNKDLKELERKLHSVHQQEKHLVKGVLGDYAFGRIINHEGESVTTFHALELEL